MAQTARNPAGFVLALQRATGWNLLEGVLVAVPRTFCLCPNDSDRTKPCGIRARVTTGNRLERIGKRTSMTFEMDGPRAEQSGATMDCNLNTAKNRMRWGLMRMAELLQTAGAGKARRGDLGQEREA